MNFLQLFIILILSVLSSPLLSVSSDRFEEKSAELITARLILNECQKVDSPYILRYEDKPFIVYPNVFSPKFFPDTYFFADHLTITPGETFLEIGSGTGLISIMAALRGAQQVTAVDINPEAVKNTTDNIFRHDLKQYFKVYLGDLFDPIPEDFRFDTIFWFVPFMHIDRDRASLSALERALFDPYYQGLERYLKEADRFLNPNGRLLLGFSSSHGDVGVLEELAQENGWDIQVIAQEEASLPVFPGLESTDAFTVMLIQLVPSQDQKQFEELGI